MGKCIPFKKITMHLCKMNNLAAPYILIKLFLSQAMEKKYCLLAVVCFPLSNFFFANPCTAKDCSFVFCYELWIWSIWGEEGLNFFRLINMFFLSFVPIEQKRGSSHQQDFSLHNFTMCWASRPPKKLVKVYLTHGQGVVPYCPAKEM